MATAKKLSALFSFSFLFCLLITTNQTMSGSDHMDNFLQQNIRKLHSQLNQVSNQSSLANYYNLTTGLASDTVHGMFLCTGDVNRTTCNSCVKTATIEITKNCTNNPLGTQANTFLWSTDRIPKTIGKLRQRLSDKMGEIIVRSSMLSSSLTPYYLMDTTRFVNLYDLQSIV
ncbi:hypothetical protein BRARA_D01135, partial [Brassica rapa]